jgi:hypothetical protein
MQVLMSISLTIHYRDTEKEKRSIHLVSYRDFNQYWKPIAIELNLEWVLLIQSAGVPIERHFDDLPSIIDELITLKTAFQNSNVSMLELIKIMRLACIEFVIKELKIICDNPDTITEAYLG